MTQFYCNKVSYNYLYNFGDLIIMKIIDKRTFTLSQVVTRIAGENNVAKFDQFGQAESYLEPTVLSTLVALLLAPHDAERSFFPWTKNLGAIPLSQSDADQYGAIPPETKTLSSSGDRSSLPSHGASPGINAASMSYQSQSIVSHHRLV